MHPDHELRSLKRALQLLRCLKERHPVSVTDLARSMNLPRSSAERIVFTLEAEGYACRVPNTKLYRPVEDMGPVSDDSDMVRKTFGYADHYHHGRGGNIATDGP